MQLTYLRYENILCSIVTTSVIAKVLNVKRRMLSAVKPKEWISVLQPHDAMI